VAAQLVTTKQTIAVLKAGIAKIDKSHPSPSGHESMDPIIVQRREIITQQFKEHRRKAPSDLLRTLWADPTIAKRLAELKLVKPPVKLMDKDQALRERIDKIFASTLKAQLRDDPVIKRQLKVIWNARNIEFYKFVETRLPKSDILKAIRKPSEV